MRWISGRNEELEAITNFPTKALFRREFDPENDPAKMLIIGPGDRVARGLLVLFKTQGDMRGWHIGIRVDRVDMIKDMLKACNIKPKEDMRFRWLERGDRVALKPDLNMMISSVCAGKKYYAKDLIAYAKKNF